MTRKKTILKEPLFDEAELKGIMRDLATFGYLLPTDDTELEGFDCVHGKTDIELPTHLAEPAFLYNRKAVTHSNKGGAVSGHIKSERSPSKSYFKKVVLAAEVAFELHEEPTFGRIKLVKLLYLCEQVCSMNLDTNYKKFAAGPLDPKLIYSIEAEFRRLKWFNAKKRDSYGIVYERLENVDRYKKYYENYYGDTSHQISHLIELFRKEKSDFCEIVATLFYVWKDCLATKSIVSDKKLFEGFYSWDEKKRRFPESRLVDALKWMGSNRVVPV